MTATVPPPHCVLAIGAHPDDIEFGCGGTLAKWAAAGTDVHFLVLTDGSKGTWSVDDDLVAAVDENDATALQGDHRRVRGEGGDVRRRVGESEKRRKLGEVGGRARG